MLQFTWLTRLPGFCIQTGADSTFGTQHSEPVAIFDCEMTPNNCGAHPLARLEKGLGMPDSRPAWTLTVARLIHDSQRAGRGLHRLIECAIQAISSL